MRASTASLSHRVVAVLAAFALAFSMAPLAWADDAPVGTAASMAAGNTENTGEDAGTQDAPKAAAQSADAKAAGSGSAGGTTVSIQVYRSSLPIVKWDLNDEDNALTKTAWDGRPVDSALPQRGTPGAEVEWPEAGMPSGYAEPTRAGFEFAGWSTDKSAPAGGYLNADPKLVFPEGAPEGGEYTLYALWTPLEYAVIFELAKNPDVGDGPGSDASFALNWSTADGIRTVTDLGNGRYHVDGFTMAGADYDATTRTVKLPEPARTGYRFLGWAEADGASGVVIDGTDGFALNPVRLPQIDGTPVLTARWASAFGVTAPLSITFGDYDKTGAPDNPSLGEAGSKAATDTTQSEADDTETPGLTDQERYEALGAAYFENTGWNDPIKMVGIASERDANASDVLTTYDSKQATEAAVLGDGTAANPGERLLSLYPAASAPADKSSGVHFRLSDSLEEGDLAKLPSIAAKAKQPVTYGLNLATDPVDGSDNHGLVLPTDDYDRKQIATVSYIFATADAADENPVLPVHPTGSTSDSLYVTVDKAFISSSSLTSIVQEGTYGLADIKAAADELAFKGEKSLYHPLFKALLEAQILSGGIPGPGPYFQVKVNNRYLDLQLIGICQDTKTAGGIAGLTFQMRDIYAYYGTTSTAAGSSAFNGVMNTTGTHVGGWRDSALRGQLRTTFMGSLPSDLQAAIAPVDKFHQLPGGTTAAYLQKTSDETIWLPSGFEVFGIAESAYNASEKVTDVPGYVPFQYQAYQGNGTTTNNPKAVKKYNGTAQHRWIRSVRQNQTGFFCLVTAPGGLGSGISNFPHGIAPCFCL